MNWSEASHALDLASSVERLWDGAVDTFQRAGFGAVIYLASDVERSEVVLRTNVPQFYDTTPPADDPFLEFCCQSYEVTRMGLGYLETHAYLPPEAQAFIRRIAEHGYVTGYGIPVRLEGARRFGGFILGTTLGVAAFEAAHDAGIDAIRAYCLLLHRRMEEMPSAGAGDLAALSPRERDVIGQVIEGATRKEIARALALSPHTVAEYTKAAYRKLGVRNKTEAVRKLIG